MIMKRILAIAILLVTVFISAGAKEKSLKYNCGDIVSITQGSSFLVSYEFHITKGKSKSVEIVYDSELEEQIKGFSLDVDYKALDKSLSVGVAQFPNKIRKRLQSLKLTPVRVYLEMDEICSIDLCVASTVFFDGTFSSSDLDIELSGAAGFSTPLRIDGRSLSVGCSGASEAAILGDFDEVSIVASGASCVDYRGNSKNIEGGFSGASKLYLQGDYREGEIRCSGASNVEMKGKGEIISLGASGASKIDAKDYSVKNAVVQLSGASAAKIAVTDELRHDVSTASKLTYYGNPKMVDLSETQNVVQGGM